MQRVSVPGGIPFGIPKRIRIGSQSGDSRSSNSRSPVVQHAYGMDDTLSDVSGHATMRPAAGNACHHPHLYSTGRHGCWCVCICGWTSDTYTTTTGAHLAFGEHLTMVATNATD